MGASVNVIIKSPHGGKTVMDLNPKQVELLVNILDGHRDLHVLGSFGSWFVERLIPHADERPKKTEATQ